jgi:YhcH/YjgK/YiaL family protein
MILDKIENFKMYTPISERIAKAFDYILSTDLETLAAGKHEVDNDDIFAIMSEYETKDIQDCSLEAHRKYIDIQYMLQGSEMIGVTALAGQAPSKVYDAADDYELFKDESSQFRLDPGRFAIFFPEDLHMPGLKIAVSAPVRKLIMKVRV